LNKLGVKVIVISNQSGIARGLFTEETLRGIHSRLQDLLNHDNAFIDKIYYCPHHPEGLVKQYAIDCDCRKPKIGMILEAERDFNIDISRSFIIGDMPRDIECGVNAGLKTILVLTGNGNDSKNEISENLKIDYIAADLGDAASYIETTINK
jgi:D-glycero-D-manno-heptose 1,7-bisphosphate phosphatase